MADLKSPWTMATILTAAVALWTAERVLALSPEVTVIDVGAPVLTGFLCGLLAARAFGGPPQAPQDPAPLP